jgi:hypothetical protein
VFSSHLFNKGAEIAPPFSSGWAQVTGLTGNHTNSKDNEKPLIFEKTAIEFVLHDFGGKKSPLGSKTISNES